MPANVLGEAFFQAESTIYPGLRRHTAARNSVDQASARSPNSDHLLNVNYWANRLPSAVSQTRGVLSWIAQKSSGLLPPNALH
jgi:hypothetical protein